MASRSFELNLNLFGRNGLQIVYQGTSHSCKVNRLLEQSVYRFRISATNDAGEGPDSDFYEFSTTIAPPPSLKGTHSHIILVSFKLKWIKGKNRFLFIISYIITNLVLLVC